MRGLVREEKEAYSIPVILGLCFCPFLLSQAVSYTRNTHSLGCYILWITHPSLAWARAVGDEEPAPGQEGDITQLPCHLDRRVTSHIFPVRHLDRRVMSHSFPVCVYHTPSQILEVGRVRVGAFNSMGPSSGRLVQGLWAHLYFLRDPTKHAPAAMLVHSPWTQHQTECFRRIEMHL